MSLSYCFAAKHDEVVGPSRYHSSTLSVLEKLSTTSITLSQLRQRMHDVVHDPKYPKFSTIVGERVDQLEQMANQLGEDIAHYPPLYFEPGCLTAELDALITRKEKQLTAAKSASMNLNNVAICQNYFRGRCTKGATCDASHTSEALERWVDEWIAVLKHDYGDQVLTLREPLGPEAWSALLAHLQGCAFKTVVARCLDKEGMRSLIQALNSKQLSTVTHLDFSKNDLCSRAPQAVVRFAKAIADCDHVTALSMGRNNLGAVGGYALCKSLTADRNNMVTSLNLQKNYISATDPNFPRLCDVLAQNQSLVKLGLASNDIGPDGDKLLFAAIAEHPNLQFLDLFCTGQGDNGAAAVANFLYETPCGGRLRYLNIAWNRISCDGLQHVTSALEHHASVEYLKLYCNTSIGRKGAAMLADMLKTNTALSVLDIRWVALGDDGGQALVDAVNSNRTLRELIACHNDMEPRTEAQLADRMKRRPPPPGGSKRSTVNEDDIVW